MNSFSIMPFEHQSILDTYQQWLVRDLYHNFYIDNLNDPNFLQKLSILQAEGVRHDIGAHAAITHDSISEASTAVGRKIQSVANLITSSLDDGFALMNQRMVETNATLSSIDKGVGAVNNNIIEGNKLQAQTNTEIQSLNKNMIVALSAINSSISQLTNVLKYQLQQVSNILQAILDELKIPESQRERRYHIEEGIKFFNMGIKTGDCLYFEDSLDEFNTAISTEKKDFFSWYYIGMIHLYSKNHIDIEKAISAFDRYIHYAAALSQKHELYDDAIIMKAECYYLEQNLSEAYRMIENLISTNVRAALRGVKYLSATGVVDDQLKAVNVLNNIMEKNPYIVMQILEDYDILCNDYITSFLREYNKETQRKIIEILNLFDQEMEGLKRFPISYYQDLNKEIHELKERVNKRLVDIGIVDAITLKEELQSMGMSAKIKSVLEQATKQEAIDNYQKMCEAKEKERREKNHKEIEYLKSHGYVDLGLPSGTIWKSENERGIYDVNSAGAFGYEHIPSEYQWRELITKCRWTWSGSLFRGGYQVKGPNGSTIYLPAEDGDVLSRNKSGHYLSKTTCEEWPFDADDDYYGEKEKHLRILNLYANIPPYISSVSMEARLSLRLAFARL